MIIRDSIIQVRFLRKYRQGAGSIVVAGCSPTDESFV